MDETISISLFWFFYYLYRWFYPCLVAYINSRLCEDGKQIAVNVIKIYYELSYREVSILLLRKTEPAEKWS